MKIIEEQLAFPSGTATAQLVSVLHELPPPDTTITRRRGYRELEYDAVPAEPTVDVPIAEEGGLLEEPESENPKPEGWSALIWSFAASGVMTVWFFVDAIITTLRVFCLAASILLSSRFLHSLVWELPRSGVVMDVYS